MTPARPDPTDDIAPKAGPRPASSGRQERDRELDHRLANSLQLAADFLIFEHTRVSDPRARAALVDTAERLSAVGQMHRFLAAHHHADGIDLEAFLKAFARLIDDSTGLDCTVEVEPVTLPAETAQQLAIAVNELAMNAAKHAYPWGERGALNIVCRRQGSNLALSVADEGAGLGKNFSAHRRTGQGVGLGMSILQAIVRQLRGTLDAANDGGARFTITIPMPAPAAPLSRSFAPDSRRSD